MFVATDVLNATLTADQLVVHSVWDLKLGCAGRTSTAMLHSLYRLQMVIDELSLHIGSLDTAQLI